MSTERASTDVPSPPLSGTPPLLRAGMVGISRVDVLDADRAAGTPPHIVVRLDPPDAVDRAPWLLDRSGYTLTGGARLHPHVIDATPVPDRADAVTLTLDGEGDRNAYTLALLGENADPFHRTATVRFRLDCATDVDCAPVDVPAAPAAPSTVRVDYLARDFAGFRQALLDLLPTRMPAWTETSPADAGIMLLELLAATADSFSYVLDRVAGEAFLGSATQRRSVAGHLALIGQHLDEGSSAATWLRLRVSRQHLLAAGFAVRGPAVDSPVFETVTDAVLRPEHNELALYDWDTPDGRLPAGATSAYLVGDLPALAAGDTLALLDATSGRAETVRLDRTPDRLPPSPYGETGIPALTRVSWSPSAPTRTEHPVASTVVAGNLVAATHGRTTRERVVVGGADRAGDPTASRGSAEAVALPPVAGPGQVVVLSVWGLPDGQDVVLVLESPRGEEDRRTRTQDIAGGLDGEPVVIASDASPGRWRALVGATAAQALGAPQAVASWEVVPEAAGQAPGSGGPGPRLRVPLGGAPLGVDDTGRPQLALRVDGVEWPWVPTLLDSGSRDRVFTLEPGSGGAATLLFGTGAFGLRPQDGAVLDLTYRVGLGGTGNVPAGSLTVPADDEAGTGPGGWLLAVSNPVPATGGRDPQSLDDARRTGPAAADDRVVAVTAQDYADAVEEFDRARGGGVVSRAGTEFRWTGSWIGVDLILDLAAGRELDDQLAADLLTFLEGRRLTGYDLQLLPARDLPLQLALTVCVRPGHLAWSVQQEVAAALRPGGPGARPGFFHPDRLSFGEPVVLSRLYLAVSAVPGVESVTVDVLTPLNSPSPAADTAQVMASGQLTVGRDEIARLDDDPARPERGRLTLVTRGGR